MGAHAALLVRKKFLAVISFLGTLGLFATTTYALTATQIDVQSHTSTDTETAAESELTNIEMDAVHDFDTSHEVDVTSGIPTEIISGGIIEPSKPITPLQPQQPFEPQSFSKAQTIENDPATEDQYTEDDADQSIQTSDDSNVRIRVRNSSYSDVNGDDIEGANSQFKLEIKESTSSS